MEKTQKPGSRQRVFVTAAGCVSGLGMNVAETLPRLCAGWDASREVTLFSTEGCRCRRAVEFPEPEAGEVLKEFPETKAWHRVGRMLLLAAREAARERPDFSPEAAVFGTTSGGMSFGEDFFRHLVAGGEPERLREKVREYVPQQAAFSVGHAMGWDVAPLIVSNACASGANAVGHAWRLIATGCCERVVCGGYDALSQLVFAGFEALKALSPGLCRPFDDHRDGLLLGEGAAVLFLESEASAAESGATPLAEIVGYGAVTDLYHLTQPEPGGSGPLGAMRRALASAGINADAVDYVNAHGTGTPHNDRSEGLAIGQLVPQAMVSSTKAMTGHTLGAAGAIEALFTILALRDGFLPPQIHTEESELPVKLVPVEQTLVAPKVALTNSFGFGGSNASLVLRKVEQS